MDSVERKNADQLALDYSSLAGDVPLIEACFRIFQQLELKDQLQALAETNQGWSGAQWVLAFGPAEDKDVFAPLARMPLPEVEDQDEEDSV